MAASPAAPPSPRPAAAAAAAAAQPEAAAAMAAAAAAAAGPGPGWEAPWRALGALGRELAAEWAAQDLRAALCQLLLLWLGLSLLGIRLAWRAYGGAVAALCYRPGPAGRNGGAADRPCPPREGPAAEPAKTHRE